MRRRHVLDRLRRGIGSTPLHRERHCHGNEHDREHDEEPVHGQPPIGGNRVTVARSGTAGTNESSERDTEVVRPDATTGVEDETSTPIGPFAVAVLTSIARDCCGGTSSFSAMTVRLPPLTAVRVTTEMASDDGLATTTTDWLSVVGLSDVTNHRVACADEPGDDASPPATVGRRPVEPSPPGPVMVST